MSSSTGTQVRKWKLSENDIDTPPRFTFPRHTGDAVLTSSQASSSADTSASKRIRRTVNVTLRLRWGSLDIIEKEEETIIHNLSLSRATIEDKDMHNLNILAVEMPGESPIRLQFNDIETCEDWRRILLESCQWSIDNFYTSVKQIGEGGFGTVFTAVKKVGGTHIPKGGSVAMKRIKREKPGDRRFASFQGELEIWELLMHESLLRAEDILLEEDYAYVISEEMELNLFKLTTEYEMKDERAQRHTLRRLLEGLQYMHRNGFLHRDIKTSNILCDDPASSGSNFNDFRIKFCDFGYSARFENNRLDTKDAQNQFRVIGTRGFRPYEVLSRGIYSPQSDIWAIGIILFILEVDEYPYDSSTRDIEYTNVKNGISKEQLEKCRPHARQLIRSMCAFKRKYRPNAEELLARDWFKPPEVPQ